MQPGHCDIKILRDIVRVRFVRYLAAFIAITFAGCSQSRFEVTEPPIMARSIDGSTDVIGSSQGVVYHATVVDNLLVFRIDNKTARPLELSNAALVDPDNVKRLLESQTIPVGGFVKLILPPPPPDPTGGPLITIDLSGKGPRNAREQTWGWPSGKFITLELSFTGPDGSTALQSIRIRRQ